jgi:hypothetical protein
MRREGWKEEDREDKTGGSSLDAVCQKEKKEQADIGPLRNSQGELVTENRAMADELYKFFTSTFTKDSSKDYRHCQKNALRQKLGLD